VEILQNEKDKLETQNKKLISKAEEKENQTRYMQNEREQLKSEINHWISKFYS